MTELGASKVGTRVPRRRYADVARSYSVVLRRLLELHGSVCLPRSNVKLLSYVHMLLRLKEYAGLQRALTTGMLGYKLGRGGDPNRDDSGGSGSGHSAGEASRAPSGESGTEPSHGTPGAARCRDLPGRDELRAAIAIFSELKAQCIALRCMFFDAPDEADESKLGRHVREILAARNFEAATRAPLLMLDTSVASRALLGGCAEATERDLLASLSDYGPTPVPETKSSASFSSLVNEGEAYAVTMHVAGLLRAGVAPAQIAVQSPYAAQVRLMQRRLREAARIGLAPGAEGVEVASVDSFQGREAEAVVVSTVRSNDRRAVGFLADARRANVAVTRARRHVAVVGDSRTVGADPFLSRRLAHIRENGACSPADEHKRLHEPLE